MATKKAKKVVAKKSVAKKPEKKRKKFTLYLEFNGLKFKKETDDLAEALISCKQDTVFTGMKAKVRDNKSKETAERFYPQSVKVRLLFRKVDSGIFAKNMKTLLGVRE